MLFLVVLHAWPEFEHDQLRSFFAETHFSTSHRSPRVENMGPCHWSLSHMRGVRVFLALETATVNSQGVSSVLPKGTPIQNVQPNPYRLWFSGPAHFSIRIRTPKT